MKILVSSKTLSIKLSEFNFESDYITAIRGESGYICLDSTKKTIEVMCEILKFSPRIKQENRRWDWVKQLVSNVDEQPIVLDITENAVIIIFQY